MEESLSCIENLINRQTEIQTEKNSEILLSISALSESQQEIRSQIIDLNASISTVLTDMKSADEKNFTAVFEKLGGLQEKLAEAGKNTKDYFSSLESLITLLKEEGKEEHRELMESLNGAKEDIASLLDQGFADMQLQMEEDLAALMEKMESLSMGRSRIQKSPLSCSWN